MTPSTPGSAPAVLVMPSSVPAGRAVVVVMMVAMMMVVVVEGYTQT